MNYVVKCYAIFNNHEHEKVILVNGYDSTLSVYAVIRLLHSYV